MDLHSFVVTVILGVLFCCINGEMEREGELERRKWSTGLDYNGGGGYHRYGGHIGYSNNGWNVRGSGWMDNNGGYGAGASISYSWRRGLPMPKNKYFLRFEANQCKFETYDSDADGIIIIEDLHSVLPQDGKLPETLLGDLDVNDDGEVDVKEFNDRKVLIQGCSEPKDVKKK